MLSRGSERGGEGEREEERERPGYGRRGRDLDRGRARDSIRARSGYDDGGTRGGE